MSMMRDGPEIAMTPVVAADVQNIRHGDVDGHA